MAALWRKPVVTWTPIKEDSDSFPTLIATLGSYEDIARNIATLLQCQGWKTIGKYIPVTVPTMSTWDKQTLLTKLNPRNTVYLSIYSNLELFQELFSDLGHTNDSFDKATCN